MYYKKSNRDYSCPHYKEFRRLVRQRDGGKCQMPGCKSRTKIHVHHIIKWSESSHLRLDPFNGICICARHHEEITGSEHNYQKLFFQIVEENYKKQKAKKKKK